MGRDAQRHQAYDGSHLHIWNHVLDMSLVCQVLTPSALQEAFSWGLVCLDLHLLEHRFVLRLGSWTCSNITSETRSNST
jgi:hypothetical protein